VLVQHGQRYNLFIGITVLQSAITVKNLMTLGELSATVFSSSTSKEIKQQISKHGVKVTAAFCNSTSKLSSFEKSKLHDHYY
jgi:hypothetical protein